MKKNENFAQDLRHTIGHAKSKQSYDYESIKKRLSVVNKSMYKTGLVYDPVSLLEKSAITGRAFEKQEPKPKKKQKKPADSLSLSLRPEHKNNKPVKIYQLPKMPFGLHKNYNEELQFAASHFKFDENHDELSKNLEVLTRKFRLNDKNYAKRAKSSHQRHQTDYQPNSDYFKMESGYLICKKEKAITAIYEKDKNRFAKDLAKVTFKNLEEEKATIKSKEMGRKCESDVIKRLYPKREDVDTPIAKFYKTKYNALFSGSEANTRPVTSFQIITWKSLLS